MPISLHDMVWRSSHSRTKTAEIDTPAALTGDERVQRSEAISRLAGRQALPLNF
jgi:hypothetical protein